jgi:class 3 adenylate cyclase
MLDTANRTFICSVVFIDLVGYSKKPVTEQIRLKTSLTNNLSEAIKDIPVNDRIILDTGDGAAISFLGDPEDALFVTLSLREAMMREGMTATMVEASGDDAVRMGINLGPVKLVKDINGHPNIIGDGINVAQRIMSFARPGQIVVSRSYYDVVSNLASEYAKLFTYEGSRTDKHVREHEIYVVGHHEGALQKARDGIKDRASSTTPNRRAASMGTSTVTLTIPSFANDRKKLTMIASGLLGVVILLTALYAMKKPSSTAGDVVATAPTEARPATRTEPPATTAPAATPPASPMARPANSSEPAPSSTPTTAPGGATPPAEAPKPETRVLSPTPAPSQVPPPAPGFDPKEAKAKPAEPAVKGDTRVGGENVKNGTAEAAGKGGIPATVFLNVDPWGEVFVNGKSQGVSPPKKFIKLEPGKYKIEIRNTTFTPFVQSVDLKARDETTLKHKFQ